MRSAVAMTRIGKFEGDELPHGVVFRGIPYALPPVGKLRFRPPEPLASIPGTYDATKFRPSCLQPLSEVIPQIGPTEMSEDCLYLNIWTPAPDTKARPVMVWIHGGAFVTGSGAFPWYEGSNLSTYDVVVVTINYRLGPFGFMYLEPLLGQNYRDSSNLGLQDQLAALRWVQDHIENFGGDPENVTVFGESAGAMSISTLLGTPSARGLFRRAIAQSGAAHNAFSPSIAGRISDKFAEFLGESTGQSLRSRRSAEKIPAEALLEAEMKTLNYFTSAAEEDRAKRHKEGDTAILLPFQPVVDGSFLPKNPLEAIVQGSASGVPLITGTTRDEYKLFTLVDRKYNNLTSEQVMRRIERLVSTAKDLDVWVPSSDTVGTTSTDVPRLYGFYKQWLEDHNRRADPKDVWSAVATDAMFRVPAIRLARAQSRYAPTRMYLFTWESPLAGGGLGSPHAIDIPFVFGNIEDPFAKLFCGEGEWQATLSAEMRSLWSSFAAGTAPASSKIPEWPLYKSSSQSPATGCIVEFGHDVQVQPDKEAEKLWLWEGIL